MRSLFEIGAELEALETTLDAEELMPGSEEPNAQLAAWFESLAEEQAEKLERLRLWIVRLEGEAAVARAEAEQFAKMAKGRESRVGWIKDQVRGYMERRGAEKLLTSTGRAFAIQKNGGKLPLVLKEMFILGDLRAEERLRFEMLVPTLNKDAVRAALEAGEVLEFAKLGERETHLRVK